METKNTFCARESTACECPSCVARAHISYTPKHMDECLARWYVSATAMQRGEYFKALCKQLGWQKRIDNLKATAERLGLPTIDFL